MASTWATQNQLLLGQTKDAEKSNEITAIPELLRLLDILGCIVTIDTLETQTEIIETIIKAGGDCFLVVKENQGHLFEDVQYLFKTLDVTRGMKSTQYQYAICSKTIRLPKAAFVISAYRLVGTMITCSLFSRIEMRLP